MLTFINSSGHTSYKLPVGDMSRLATRFDSKKITTIDMKRIHTTNNQSNDRVKFEFECKSVHWCVQTNTRL